MGANATSAARVGRGRAVRREQRRAVLLGPLSSTREARADHQRRRRRSMGTGRGHVPESSRADGLRAVHAADASSHGEAGRARATGARRHAWIRVRRGWRSGTARLGRHAGATAWCAARGRSTVASGGDRLTTVQAAGTVAWMTGPDTAPFVDRLDGDLAREVASAPAGHAAAAEGELYRRFARRIRLFGLRHLRDDMAADDLAQQVMLIAIERLRAGEIR